MKRKALSSIALSLAGLALVAGGITFGKSTKRAAVTFATYTNGDAATYYNSINSSKTGNDLLKDLRTLNLAKRQSTVGYSSMGTSPSGQFKYTDYDPNYVSYDENGQPYGTRISSFYTYTSATSWNREHVWPNSHGGGSGGSAGTPYPDADIHMPRPTISSENSSRGNSFFVEGMNHSSNGWDPYTAGYSEESRGEAARITFYCMTVNSKLSLAPNNTSPSGKDPITGNSYSSGTTMGNLETLLKWNINYPVTQREKNRNEGAEYLQGNRNAFVDHPEYACKIWGGVNSTTQSLCNSASWDEQDGVSISKTSASISVDESITINATATDNSTITWKSNNTAVVTVSSNSSASGANVTLTGVSAGSTTVEAKATIDSTTYTVTCAVTVKESGGGGGGESDQDYILVTSNSSLSNGDKVVLTMDHEREEVMGVTGWNNQNDATVSNSNTNWKEYTVTNASGSGFKLKDDSADKYVASPTDNHFKYDTSGGTISVATDGKFVCNSRYLCRNGTNYRCYKSVGSYIPFYIYKVNSSVGKTLDHISIATPPSKTIYTAGEYFSPTGLVITKHFTDNTSESYTYAGHTSEFSFSPSLTTTLQTSHTSITVTYGGKSVSQTITVNAVKTLSNITIHTAPIKLSYYAGDNFDPTGLVIRRNFSDNSTDTYTYAGHESEFTFTPSLSTALTTSHTNVTIGYNSRSASQNITVSSPILSSITTENETTEYEIGEDFSYNGICTAHYNNGTSKVVTPVVETGTLNMNKQGVYQIQLSYTEGGVTKTTSYSISVIATPFVNTIEQLYSRTKGSLSGFKFYGLYMGYTSHYNSKQSKTLYDIFIGNGDYGILFYEFSDSVPSYEPFETGLSVTGGSLDIYSNLYEVKSTSTDTAVIATIATSEISQYVAPVSAYSITGDEVGTNTADQKTASRLATLTGTVATVDKTINGTNDVNVTVTLAGSKTANVFIKRNAANLDYEKLAASVVVGKEVTLRGFTSIYSEKYQLINPEVVEESSTYGYEEFAADVLELTNEICTSSGDKETSLSFVWMNLEVYKYSVLSSEAKLTLVGYAASESGDVVARAMARYDRICQKYESCSNFIGRSTANYVGSPQINIGGENNSAITLIVVISLLSTTSLGILLVIKKKRLYK